MVRESVSEEKKYDLAVIGAGLAGICASIAAARLGLKVALVNDRPVLGGNSSTEIRVHVGGADKDFRWARESGILEEIRIEDRFRSPVPIVSGKINPTWQMVLWEWVTREPNLDLYLNTSARSAIMDSDNRIAGALCEQLGTEKTIKILASYFIDSSGDGSLAFSAGADCRKGREARDEFGEDKAPEVADEKTQGASLLFSAVDLGHPVKFERPGWAEEYPTEDDLPLRGHTRVTSGYWWIELGGEDHSVYDNERLRDELWRCLYGVWDHIKNSGDHGAGNLALDWVGSVPGKRESRRFLGDYVLRQQDVESMGRFPDSVAYGGWPVDIHAPGGIRQPGIPADMYRLPGPYAIPFRSLYSRNIGNLMMAGRNISVTHVALGTTRLQATCAVEGEAVGTAAYLCCKYKKTPREVYRDHLSELQQLLLKDDCYIPGIANQDPSDLARDALVTATSDMPLQVYALDSFHQVDRKLGQIFPLTGNRLDTVSLFLRGKEGLAATLRLRRAGHWTDTSSDTDIATATSRLGQGEGWVDFQLGIDIEPGFYWIFLDPAPGIQWGFSKQEPVGVQITEEGLWRRLGGSYLFRTFPESRPYGAENVINGFTRPEDWTSIWISDPEASLPQSLQLDLPSPVILEEVRLTLDTDLDDLPKIGPSDKCIRDYSLSYRDGEGWHEFLEVRENHHRVNVHRTDPTRVEAVRVEARRTWGSPSARIYEVRLYGRPC